MLGIIGAMAQEVAALKEAMNDVEVCTAAGMNFYKGTIHGRDVVVVRSGIGKVNAAVCCQILADRYNVDAVVNTGIAGSLRAMSCFLLMRCSMIWMLPASGTRWA